MHRMSCLPRGWLRRERHKGAELGTLLGQKEDSGQGVTFWVINIPGWTDGYGIQDKWIKYVDKVKAEYFMRLG